MINATFIKDYKEDFRKELEQLINKYNLENENDTPDFIIADYLCNCLINYNRIIKQKNEWYGRKCVVGGGLETLEDGEWVKNNGNN